ncbi:MAG: ABC transporter ATP-binding protein [Desulfurellaceae bacterium]|nr:ABC transporter ATP-binding protein [Desulfurellaceae bacterium]
MSYFEVKNLVKKFGGLTAVNDVSFSIEKGKIFGLIGPNGSGKTTIFNCINHYYPLSGGKIYFKEKRIDKLPTYEICKLGIGRTFQIVKPLRRMTTLENVMSGAFLKTSNITKAKDKALEVLDFCDLFRHRHFPAKGLTIANKKRLEIARALATEPELLLLDEVAAGLNPKETETAMEIIQKIRSSGITILIVEHVMKVMMGISDRIMVINFGKEIARGTPQEIVNNQEVIKAYLGESYAQGK